MIVEIARLNGTVLRETFEGEIDGLPSVGDVMRMGEDDRGWVNGKVREVRADYIGMDELMMPECLGIMRQ